MTLYVFELRSFVPSRPVAGSLDRTGCCTRRPPAVPGVRRGERLFFRGARRGEGRAGRLQRGLQRGRRGMRVLCFGVLKWLGWEN